jgi:hypothetical protein
MRFCTGEVNAGSEGGCRSEQSFDAFEDDGVAALKEELEQLKAKIAAGVIAAKRPALDG